jgi:hypothetical protein
MTHINLTRKDKAKGFVPGNLIFTNPSEATKTTKKTHKYLFENKLLGTRDIKNILKQRGINITMESIVKRLSTNTPLFSVNRNAKFMYKEKLRNWQEIGKLENVHWEALKGRVLHKHVTIEEAVKYFKTININYVNPLRQSIKCIKQD